MYKTITTKKPLLPLHELFPDIFFNLLYYIQAPSMIISRINSTNTIAALDPVPHPQLPIIHSSFFSIHNILWKNKKSVLYFINNKKIKLKIVVICPYLQNSLVFLA